MHYHPTEREPDWRERAEREVRASPRPSDGVELLRQCLVGIEPLQGWALAQASLALVPRDLTRFYLTLSVPWSRSQTAIALLNRFGRHARPQTTRLEALLSLAARTCSLGLFVEARAVYREATRMDPQSACAWICAFNLSCLIGSDEDAESEARELGRLAREGDARMGEVQGILEGWIESRSDSERVAARNTARRLHGRIPEAAAVVCRGYES